MIHFTTLYNEYIDHLKTTEQKRQFEYSSSPIIVGPDNNPQRISWIFYKQLYKSGWINDSRSLQFYFFLTWSSLRVSVWINLADTWIVESSFWKGKIIKHISSNFKALGPFGWNFHSAFSLEETWIFHLDFYANYFSNR